MLLRSKEAKGINTFSGKNPEPFFQSLGNFFLNGQSDIRVLLNVKHPTQ